MANLLFGFWNFEPKLNADFQKSLLSLYRELPQPPTGLLLDEDIDRLIGRAGAIGGHEWLCVIAVGLVFWDKSTFLEAVYASLRESKEPMLVKGQLINKKGHYCGIHEQMFFVHLPTYQRLGQPKFGGYEGGVKRLQNYIAGPSLHEDYTPASLMPLNHFGRDLIERKTWTCGWSFVDASMRAGLRIVNLSPKLREQKTYIYPSSELEQLNKNLDLIYQMEDVHDRDQRRLMAYLFNRRLRYDVSPAGNSLQIHVPKGSWTLVNPQHSLAAVNARVFDHPVDTYVGPCSGLLDLVALFANGFHAQTRLIFYDLNPKAIEYKKLMFERFDGKISTLRATREKSLSKSEVLAWQELEHSFNYLQAVFGSSLEQLWSAIRELPREFMQINLLTEAERLLSQLPPERNTLLVVDDIFLSTSQLAYGQKKLSESRQSLINECANHRQWRLLGKDLTVPPVSVEPSATL